MKMILVLSYVINEGIIVGCQFVFLMLFVFNATFYVVHSLHFTCRSKILLVAVFNNNNYNNNY